MAEMLGAVASGLAVAEVGLKVGGTVWKLKRLWQQVHEVPQTIKDLMRQIEIMDPVLASHETNLDVQNADLLENLPTRHGSPTTLSAAYCREALNDLRLLVEDLDCAIKAQTRSKRTFARVGVARSRVEVVLKKDTIKGFQDRLEMAMNLLQFTQVTYLAANATIMRTMVTDVWTAVTSIRSQQQLLMKQLSNDKGSGPTGILPFPVISSHLERSQKPILDRRKSIHPQGNRIHIPWSGLSVFGRVEVRKSDTEATEEATYAVRFQLPKWLSRKVWDISISRACSGWQGSLSTWNVVPGDSPGMLCAERGDLDGLIDLFDRGLASPRDCDIDGCTIFHAACSRLHIPIVKFFLSMNLDKPFITAGHGELAVCAILASGLPRYILSQLGSQGLFDNLADAAEDLEFLSEPVEDNIVNLSSILALTWTMDRPTDFEFAFRTCFPFWRSLPPRRKQEMLMPLPLKLTSENCLPFWTHSAFRLLFSPGGPIRKIDVQAWIDGGASLLHQVFYCYLNSSSRDLNPCWKTLLQEVIKATDDVHFRLELPYARVDLYAGTFRTVHIGACSALEWALVAVLSGLLSPGHSMVDAMAPTRWLLKNLTAKLQAIMSVLARYGYDLLEFGQQEAAIWVSGDKTDRIVGDALNLGIGDQHDGFPYVKALHFGPEPEDWYFELDFYYEDYVGDFWKLLENSHLLMPGAWIEDE